jgi:Zn-dependent peptidase ImmA (M78 family)
MQLEMRGPGAPDRTDEQKVGDKLRFRVYWRVSRNVLLLRAVQLRSIVPFEYRYVDGKRSLGVARLRDEIVLEYGKTFNERIEPRRRFKLKIKQI